MNSLPQLVEYGCAPLDERVPVRCGLDSLPAAVDEANTERAYDCVATYNKDLHDASLKVMGSRFDMLSSVDVMEIWDRGARTSIAAQ